LIEVLMLKSRIRGGVHPRYHKNLAADRAIEAVPLPKKLEIPLSQHLGLAANPVVSKGDVVQPGDLLAEAPKLISANVHSPVAGKVRNVVQKPLPGGWMCDYVEIQVDADATAAHEWKASEPDFSAVDREWLVKTLRGAGIVGMGGATFPTDVKFSPPPTANLDVFILNGAECEPYLTCDNRVMIEHAEQILRGIELADAAFGFDRVILAIEKNKPEAIRAMRAAVSSFAPRAEGTGGRRPAFEIAELDVLYPQGAEKMLIRSVTGRVVPAGKLPFEVGAIVSNVQSMFALYEAAYLGKPLIERVVTISGDGIHEPKNVRALIGTSVSELAEFAGGAREETTKVVAGGPMTGTALPSLDYSVAKGLSGLLFLTQQEYPDESPCIHCGTCVDVCPMRLMPLKLAAYAKAGKFEEAKATNLTDCFECGSCAWACPSNIKIVSWIKYAKNYIRVKGL
jgi:electron transport complex protein RnfC